jgi:hypothetical protein
MMRLLTVPALTRARAPRRASPAPSPPPGSLTCGWAQTLGMEPTAQAAAAAIAAAAAAAAAEVAATGCKGARAGAGARGPAAAQALLPAGWLDKLRRAPCHSAPAPTTARAASFGQTKAEATAPAAATRATNIASNFRCAG